MSWVAANSMGSAPFGAALQRRWDSVFARPFEAAHVADEVRPGDPRVGRDRADRAPLLAQSALQFEREQEIGQLRVL